jgi:hypothetical protein
LLSALVGSAAPLLVGPFNVWMQFTVSTGKRSEQPRGLTLATRILASSERTWEPMASSSVTFCPKRAPNQQYEIIMYPPLLLPPLPVAPTSLTAGLHIFPAAAPTLFPAAAPTDLCRAAAGTFVSRFSSNKVALSVWCQLGGGSICEPDAKSSCRRVTKAASSTTAAFPASNKTKFSSTFSVARP